MNRITQKSVLEPVLNHEETLNIMCQMHLSHHASEFVLYTFSYFYYSDSAISYTEYIMGYNIMAQPHGLTRLL